jgi:hypothetical protein
MQLLREMYQVVYNLTHAADVSDRSDIKLKLESLEAADILSNMVDRCRLVEVLKEETENSRLGTLKMVFFTLRSIAEIQSEIQFKLKKDVDWLKKWISAANDGYYTHLFHITELSNYYHSMLLEIRRRKRYDNELNQWITSTKSRLREMTAEEVRHRESFMRECGVYLPSCFFKLYPSLKEKPPFLSLDGLLDSIDLPSLEEDVKSDEVVSVDEDLPATKNSPPYLPDAVTALSVLKEKNTTALPEVSVVAELQDKIRILEQQIIDMNSLHLSSHPSDITVSTLRNVLRSLTQPDITELLHEPACRIVDEQKGQSSSDLPEVSLEQIARETLGKVESVLNHIRVKEKYPVITFMDFHVGAVALFMPAFVSSVLCFFSCSQPFLGE